MSQLFIDHCDQSSENVLIKIKIDFSKEAFAYMVLLPVDFPKITRLPNNFQDSQDSQMKGLPK